MANDQDTQKTFSADFAESAKGAGYIPGAAAQRIMAKHELVSNDTWVTGLNNNDLIVGPTGSGKTRYYVKPNLLQMNESVIVTDTKGTLVREVGPLLEKHGYEVMCIDFTDPAAGTGYNPFDFVRCDQRTGRVNERDVVRVAKSLCPIESHKEPFWDFAAEQLLSCFIAYVAETLPEEDRTPMSILKLVPYIGTDAVDELMRAHEFEQPGSMAYRRWSGFKASEVADRMNASIVGIMNEKLVPLSFADTQEMFCKRERVDFAHLGQRKCALFLKVSDVDRSMDRLVSLLYAQALQALVEYADDDCGGALPVPVRMYLDDFATNCRIADFDKIISVIRSRNIAVSVVLQSLTQLETLYTHAAAMTIVNGCDHLLYLGGQDIETAEFVSKKANCLLDNVLNQPVGTVWLFERGKRGKTVQRYELEEHELYQELPEAANAQNAAASGFERGESPDALPGIDLWR